MSNHNMGIYRKISTIYSKEGAAGIARRIGRHVNTVKQLGVKGSARRVVGKIKSIKDGRYSLNHAYDQRFFLDNLHDSRPMAEYLAPKIAKNLDIKSVVDLGCATGHWVHAFEKAGVDVLGIEGGERARTMLVCTPEKVIFADLRDPLNINKDFDLAMSIEVAEHIEGKFADAYVNNILSFHPKIVMLTAATPGQGGEFHVNEQDKAYWEKKFFDKGYVRAPEIEEMIAQLVESAKNEKNPPEIMKNPTQAHHGVFVPFWMPKNLVIFKKNVAS